MWRVMCAGVIGVALLSARPLLAQGPPSKDSVQKLQAELEVLKMLIKDVEARLEKAKGELPWKPGIGKGKGPGGPPGFGKGPRPKAGEMGGGPPGYGPPGFGKRPGGPPGFDKPWPRPGEFGKGPPPGFGKPWPRPGEFGKGPGFGHRPGMGPWGKPGEFDRGPRGGWRGPGPGGRPAAVSNEDILRRLNQILREVEDLRWQIQKR